MSYDKLKQPHAILAGGSLLIGAFFAYFINGLPNGYISIVSAIRNAFSFYDFTAFMESFLWLLVLLSWAFAGIVLLTGGRDLSSIALLIFGGLYLVYVLFVIFAYREWVSLMTIPLTAGMIMAGIWLRTYNMSLRTPTVIVLASGLLLEIIREIIMCISMVSNGYYAYTLGAYIGTRVLWIITTIFLALGIFLAVLSAMGETTVTGYGTGRTQYAERRAAVCPNCGAGFGPGASFCGNCGTALAGASVEFETPAYQAGTSQNAQTAQMYTQQQGQQYRQSVPQQPRTAEADAPSTGFAVLGAFFPLVGLILYLVWKDQLPLRAKSAGKGAIIGAIIAVVVWVIYAVSIAVLVSQY